MNNAPLIWKQLPPQQPGQTVPYYINTVAITANGERVVTGTYSHDYSSADARRGIVTPETIFGTYCYGADGCLLWQDTWSGYEGVYWTATTPCGDWSASSGQYSQVPYRGFVFIYDANGNRTVSWTDAPSRVSMVQISANGTACVAAGEAVYVFLRTGCGFGSTPMIIPLPPPSTGTRTDSAQALAVDPTGTWIVVGTYQGRIIMYRIDNGLPVTTGKYMGTLSVHSIGMNAQATGFLAGTGDGQVLYFDVAQFAISNRPTWSTTLVNGAGTQAASVYGVAINTEGTLASAVGNIGNSAGVLGLLDLTTSSATWSWVADTEHNPNSTSMNGDGSLISVADGHPDGTPGAFYAFSSAASDPAPKTALWIQPSGNMSWPMQISSSGNAAVAGSDDGYVYYFKPVTS